VYLDHRDLLQGGRTGVAERAGAADPLGPARGGYQDVLFVAERSRREQGTAWPDRADDQIVMPGSQSLQCFLGGAEGGAQGEALAVLAGQLRERGQRPFGGELRRAGQMQGP
jgi:hypothetical protein